MTAPETNFVKPMLFKSRRYINRWFYEVMPDGAWKDKPCFIVGGGPSLKDFDFSLLRGHRTIGVNRAFEKFNPTIIFSMDTRFLNWLYIGKYSVLKDGAEVTRKFKESRAYKVWLCTYVVGLPDEIFIIRTFQNYKAGLRAFTFSMKDGIGHGNNSGYGALNLAVCLKANPIYLLGFDMKHESGGVTHWHAGHPMRQKEKTVTGFIKFFERAGHALRGKGISVVNLNPNSALNVFPKKKLEEVLG